MLNIIYDFDGTLTNKPIPEIKFISKLGYTNQDFNTMISKAIANSDIYTGYYTVVLDLLLNGSLPNNDSTLTIGSNDVVYNTGLESYLNQYKDNIKHYILSSGIQVYIENTVLAHYFTGIYGTTFKYDNDSNIIDLDVILSDDKKVEIIKQINIDNGRQPLDSSNLLYIGDGMTDYYAFKFVKETGGTSIIIYTDEQPINDELIKVTNKAFKADYRPNSDLVKYIKKLV